MRTTSSFPGERPRAASSRTGRWATGTRTTSRRRPTSSRSSVSRRRRASTRRRPPPRWRASRPRPPGRWSGPTGSPTATRTAPRRTASSRCPAPAPARDPAAVPRPRRLRPRPLRGGLHHEHGGVDHRQRVRVQAAQGAPPRGPAHPRRLPQDLPGAAHRHRGGARAARQVRPAAARRDREAEARALRQELRPGGLRGAEGRPRLREGRREHQLPTVHALARPVPLRRWRR